MKYLAELKYLTSIEQNRCLREIDSRSGCKVRLGDKELIDLSSNDYLSIAGNIALRTKFKKEVDTENYPFSASASRLLSGNFSVHEELESVISRFYVNKDVVVYNSGYQANVGIISALISRKDVVFTDKQIHASIIDGIKLSGAKLWRYKHNDMDSLRVLLDKYRKQYNKAWIITESIFSMDGDIADLKQIIEYKKKYNLSVFVDEAHAFGVRGEKGEGVCVELGIDKQVDLIIGTFGKAIASVGAFVACDKVIKEYLINKSRSFIFSTALPPINILWTKWLLENIIPHLKDKREHLTSIAYFFRKELSKRGLSVLGDSQIVPLIIGENKKALELSKSLEKAGFLAFALRPPTVPQGSSRIRFSLCSDITIENLEQLIFLLDKIWNK